MTSQLVLGSKTVPVYTDHNDADLPDDVKSLPSNVRRRWINSHNYHVMENGDPEAARSYAHDNTYMTLAEAGSLKKKEAVETAPKSEGLLSKIKGLLGGASGSSVSASPFMVYKQGDGWRVLTVYSNKYKDKQKEILSEASHKEYVEWVEKTGLYPEFHLWHGGPGTKFGKADFVDYIDGFAVASGPVDSDKHHIAEALSKENLAVSHGFFGLKSEDAFNLYRTFEISPLPYGTEANALTAINMASKELQMPFSDKKKAWLKDTGGFTDAQIAEFEGTVKSLGERAGVLGIDYKEDAGNDQEGIPSLVASMNQLNGVVSQLTGVIAEQSKELKAVKEAQSASTEDVLVAALTPKIAHAMQGFKASEDDGNKADPQEVERLKEVNDGDFFTQMIASNLGVPVDQVGKITVGAASNEA